MNHYKILFKPRSLDDRVELELVVEKDAQSAMFKWLRDNSNTNRHFSGYGHDAMTAEQIELFNTDYEEFRKQNFKDHPAFGYN